MKMSDGLGHIPVGLLIEELHESSRVREEDADKLLNEGKYIRQAFSLQTASYVLASFAAALERATKKEHGHAVGRVAKQTEEE